MRSPGVVYKKLKEVKYYYLVALYRKYFKKEPENCIYNKEYLFEANGQRREIRLCLLHTKGALNLNMVDICEKSHHCNNCDAFIFRYTKEDIKKIMEKDLSDKVVRQIKYPNICALEWVLERSIEEPPISMNWFQRTSYFIKRVFKKSPW